MSYLAIARKYRPATFEEMVGQDHVTRTLRNALERERIHHAFLFCGARGVGKTTAARALARALNCKQGPTPSPCGACTPCTEIAGGASPDFIEIDGASNNSVDDVREIRDTVRYAPSRGRYKVYLVDEVHMLSKGAFTALLKTLEEPPPHVVFLFATTESTKIPDAILSRVQRFDFKRIPASTIADRLATLAEAEGVRIDGPSLRLIARGGNGSMRDAESLLDQVIAFSGPVVQQEQVVEALGLVDRGLIHRMLGGMVRGEPETCLEVVAEVHDRGHDLAEFTAEMLETLRNATFTRLAPGTRRFLEVAPEELELLDQLTQDVAPETLTRAFQAMLEVHDQVARSTRPRVVLEMAVARLATVRPMQPVAALLRRVEDLERRLRQGGSSGGRGGMRAPRQSRASRSSSVGDRDDEPSKPAPTPPPHTQTRAPEEVPGPEAKPAPAVKPAPEANPVPEPKPTSAPSDPEPLTESVLMQDPECRRVVETLEAQVKRVVSLQDGSKEPTGV